MGARIDRATHYLFGTAFYTLLANLLSEKVSIIVSPIRSYNILKEAYLNGTFEGIKIVEGVRINGSYFSIFCGLILLFIPYFFPFLSMKVSVVPDSIDKPIDEYENHRKFGHSFIFIIICTIVSYIIIYFISYFLLYSLSSIYTFMQTHYTAIETVSNIFGINIAFLIFTSLLSHLLLDIITYSGVPLFYPISKKYYSLRLMHSGSPIMLLILLLSLLYILFYVFLPIASSFFLIFKGTSGVI